MSLKKKDYQPSIILEYPNLEVKGHGSFLFYETLKHIDIAKKLKLPELENYYFKKAVFYRSVLNEMTSGEELY